MTNYRRGASFALRAAPAAQRAVITSSDAPKAERTTLATRSTWTTTATVASMTSLPKPSRAAGSSTPGRSRDPRGGSSEGRQGQARHRGEGQEHEAVASRDRSRCAVRGFVLVRASLSVVFGSREAPRRGASDVWCALVDRGSRVTRRRWLITFALGAFAGALIGVVSAQTAPLPEKSSGPRVLR